MEKSKPLKSMKNTDGKIVTKEVKQSGPSRSAKKATPMTKPSEEESKQAEQKKDQVAAARRSGSVSATVATKSASTGR